MVKLHIGNLADETTDNDLRRGFEAHGTVDIASVVLDTLSSRSKGFGFVEMPNDAEARMAIGALNETDMNGRKIVVTQARPSTRR